MFITPSFKKSLIVEQFQGNYLKRLQMEDSFFGQKETGAERVAMATALRASFCFFCGGQLWCQVSRTLL